MRIYLAQSAGGLGKYLPSSYGAPHRTAKAMRAYLAMNGHAPSDPATLAAGVKASAADFAGQPLRLLFSYHYFKEIDLDALLEECFGGLGLTLDLFADSGAYTAMSTGASIDLLEYARWLKRWRHRFTSAATLDVINEPVASYNQTQQLLDLSTGVEIVPVVHGRDPKPFDWLSRYLSEGFSYIGLGGIAGNALGDRSLVEPFFARAFTLKPPEVRYHGFGMTIWKLMKAFPWHSVDSSSWTSGFRYASVALFDSALGRWEKVNMAERAGLLKHQRVLATYRLRPTAMRNTDYDRDLLCSAAVLSWMRAEAHLTRQRSVRCPVPSATPK